MTSSPLCSLITALEGLTASISFLVPSPLCRHHVKSSTWHHNFDFFATFLDTVWSTGVFPYPPFQLWSYNLLYLYIPPNLKFNWTWVGGCLTWELPGNYPVFTMVMVIYHYVERIWRVIIDPNFLYNVYDHEKISSSWTT